MCFSVRGSLSVTEHSTEQDGSGHRFDYDAPIEETMQALHEVVKAGYVRDIGMSSCCAYQCALYLFLSFSPTTHLPFSPTDAA